MHMKKWQAGIIVSLVGVSALAITWGICQHQDKPSMPSTSTAAITAVAERSDTLSYRTGTPQLDMIGSQVLASMPVPVTDMLNARAAYDDDATARIGVGIAGRIIVLKAAPGDHVKAGQVLAEIDSPDFGSALADLSKARADEERKRNAFERARVLAPGDAIASKDWEAAHADYIQARAERARAEQRVKNINPHGLHADGQRIKLSSPIDGIVTERSASLSLEVTPGMSTPLFVVTNPKRLWLLIDVPEQNLRDVKMGGPVDVESDAFPGEHFHAKIAQTGQLVDPNTRRVAVRARLENPEAKLLPEMFVRASLLQNRGNAVRVPNSALVNRGIYTYVFVQSAPGQFKRRQIKLLTNGSEFSYVGTGLASGENVVTTGAMLLDAEMSARAGDKP